MPSKIDKLEIAVTERIEKTLCGTGWFKLEHNGESSELTQGGVMPSYYTRKYRMYLDNQPVNTWLWFRYNRRDGWADVDIRIRDTAGVRPSTQELSARKLVKALEKSLTSESPASMPIYDPLEDNDMVTLAAGVSGMEEQQEWAKIELNISKNSPNVPDRNSPERLRSWLQRLLTRHSPQR